MRISTRMHYKALTDLVEFMSIISTFAIGVDLYWCLSDFIEQNYTMRLIPIIFGLLLAFIGMCFAVGKYHVKLVKHLRNECKVDKILRNRRHDDVRI